MKTSRAISVATLLLFLASCGPARLVPVSSSPAPGSVSTQLTHVKPWPGLKDGWTNFNGLGYYFSAPVYDPAGYLWATDRSSVYRWDIHTGESIRFTVSDGLPETVLAIVNFNGTIWASSNANDGTVADFSDGKWVSHSIGFGAFSAFSITKDRLWASGEKGLYYLDGREWKRFELLPDDVDNRFLRVAESKDGSLWFSSYRNMLRFKDGSWQDYQNLINPQSIYTLSDGTLLFLYGDLIMSFDGQGLRPLGLPGDQYHYSIDSALPTPEGDLWLQVYDYHTDIGAEGYPTYLIHDGQVRKLSNWKFENKPDPDIYAPTDIIPEGWVFTESRNIYLYDGKRWKKFSADGSAFEQVVGNSVIGFDSDGLLWTMRSGLPVSFDGQKARPAFEGKDQCGSSYDAKIGPGGSIWAKGDMTDYICYYDVQTKTISRFNLFFRANSFDVAPDGSIWVSSGSGFIANLTLDILRSGDYRRVKLIKVGGDEVQYVLIPDHIEIGPDGAVWVFVKGSGLYRYDEVGWKYYGMSELKDSTAFAIDSKGHVWVGLCGALMMNDGEKWTSYPQHCINPSHMIIAPDDAVWFVNSCDGIYRFNGKEWTHFTNEQIGGFIPERILVAPDGALWFVSYQKWTRYKP